MTRHPSLTLRLALLFAASATVVLVSVALLIRVAVERHFAEQDLAEIAGKAELIAALLARTPPTADPDGLRHRLDDALVGHHGLAVAVWSGEQRIYAATGGPPHRHEAMPATDPDPADIFAVAPPPVAAPTRATLAIWDAGGSRYRGLRLALPAAAGAAPTTLGLALDLAHHRDFMRELDRSLALAVLLGALTLAGCGWWAARRGLAPLRALAEVAHGISAERLTPRLDLAGVPAELREVGESFNAMLGRLEDAFVRLSDFSADLAHELRTPLGNLMTQTQVALSKTRSAAEYAEVLHSNLEEYNRLARMIGDMLFLAKAEHGLAVPRREAVQLDAEVRQLFEFFEALAEDGGVTLRLDGAATVAGDRGMLRRALANLLGNALRHTAAGGSVGVALTTAADAVEVEVANPGPEIPAELLPRVFDRFVRADPARHGGEGAGLGLAITRAIVIAHGGSITAESADGVTRFRLRLPAGP